MVTTEPGDAIVTSTDACRVEEVEHSGLATRPDMTSVTAPVLYTSYGTRPVTLCRKCGEPIGDEMVNEGHIVFLVDGLPSTEVILHPGCWVELERMKPLGFADRLLPLAAWPRCPWCGRRWWSGGFIRANVTGGLCSDACRKARYRARLERVPGRCDGCAAQLAGRSDSRFCSPKCRQSAYRARRRSQDSTGTQVPS